MKVSIVDSAVGSFCWNYTNDTFYRNLQVPTSVAVMQVLKFYCNYVSGTFYYTYVGGSFCCNYAGDYFCCNLQLEVSAAFLQVKVFAGNLGDKFY